MKAATLPIVVRMNAGTFQGAMLRLAVTLFWAWVIVCIEDLTRAHGDPTNDAW